jgi:predicted GNAT family acetyltransferase
MMRITQLPRAGDFLGVVREWLERRETANNLILSVIDAIAKHPERYTVLPYLAVVQEDASIVTAVLMTPPEKLLLVHSESLAAFPLIAKDLLEKTYKVPAVLGPPRSVDAFTSIWCAQARARVGEGIWQRVYEIRELKAAERKDGRLRLAEMSELETLSRWCEEFVADSAGDTRSGRDVCLRAIQDRRLFVWETNSRVVTMASYSGQTEKGARISLVYTPTRFRRNGYASACVAELTRLLFKRGFQYCSLITDLANATSNHIYQEIGYLPVTDWKEQAFQFEDTNHPKHP